MDVRETLDESKLVDDLAALVGDLLLCGLKLLLGSVLLEGDLYKRVLACHPFPQQHVVGVTCVELGHFERVLFAGEEE